MDFEELYRRVANAHVHKLSYPECVLTSLYNEYPSVTDGIEISFEKTPTNHKLIDLSSIGIMPGTLANQFLQCFGDPR